MPNNPNFAETIKQHYRVDRREIAYIRFILEAYDGLAIVKTLDPQAGLIEFQIAPGCEQDVEMILEDLQSRIMMEKAVI
jgi:hypothetical protein